MTRVSLTLLLPVFLCGCGSVMEKVVPPGTAQYNEVLNAADIIPNGTPKWMVKMKLGLPQTSGEREWRYICYGPKMAEAHIFFNEKGKVTDVQTNARKEFYGRSIIRRIGR